MQIKLSVLDAQTIVKSAKNLDKIQKGDVLAVSKITTTHLMIIAISFTFGCTLLRLDRMSYLLLSFLLCFV